MATIRVMLCIDDERPPFAFVSIEGTAVTSCRPMPWSGMDDANRRAIDGTRPSRRLREAQRRRGRTLGSRSALEGESATRHRGLMTPDATASAHAGVHSDHPPSQRTVVVWETLP